MKRHLSLAIPCLLPLLLWGQHSVLPVPQIGIGMQSIVYQGDLSPKDSAIHAFMPGAVLSLCFPGKRLSPSVNAAFGTIQGQQTAAYTLASPPAGIVPNQFVETPFTTLSARLRWNLLVHTRVTPYLSPGIGITLFDPQDNLGNSLSANPKSRLSGEYYTGVTATYSLSAGVLFRLTDQHLLQAEASYMPVATDYLDNIGQLGKVQGNDRMLCLQMGILIGLAKGKSRKLEQRASQDTLLASALPATAERTTRSYDLIYYPVKRTDNLDSLAAQFQVPVATIEQLNAVYRGNALPKGMVLRLPNTAWASDRPPIDEKLLQEALDNKRFVYYQIRQGETLQSLSRKSGVPVATIRQLNFLFTSDAEAGDLLRMPDIRAK